MFFIEWGLYLYVVVNDSQTLGHDEYNSAPNSISKLYYVLHIQVVLHIISTEERISTKDGASRGKWRYSSAVCNLCYTQQATEYSMQALRCIFLGVLWTVGRPGNDGNPLLYSINLMHNCTMNDDDISACLSLLVLIPNILILTNNDTLC